MNLPTYVAEFKCLAMSSSVPKQAKIAALWSGLDSTGRGLPLWSSPLASLDANMAKLLQVSSFCSLAQLSLDSSSMTQFSNLQQDNQVLGQKFLVLVDPSPMCLPNCSLPASLGMANQWLHH